MNRLRCMVGRFKMVVKRIKTIHVIATYHIMSYARKRPLCNLWTTEALIRLRMSAGYLGLRCPLTEYVYNVVYVKEQKIPRLENAQMHTLTWIYVVRNLHIGTFCALCNIRAGAQHLLQNCIAPCEDLASVQSDQSLQGTLWATKEPKRIVSRWTVKFDEPAEAH